MFNRQRRTTPPRRPPRAANLRRALARPARLDRRRARSQPGQRGRRALAHVRPDALPVARGLPRDARGAHDSVSCKSDSDPLLNQRESQAWRCRRLTHGTMKTDSSGPATSSLPTRAWTFRPATPARRARWRRARRGFAGWWTVCRGWRLAGGRRAGAVVATAGAARVGEL